MAGVGLDNVLGVSTAELPQVIFSWGRRRSRSRSWSWSPRSDRVRPARDPLALQVLVQHWDDADREVARRIPPPIWKKPIPRFALLLF